MTTGIYSITNTANGHRYIGSAVNLKKRWSQHRRGLLSGSHHSRYLQRAWEMYGKGAFLFEVLEECEVKNLIEREQWWMDAGQPEYNACRVAGSRLGAKASSETKAKLTGRHPSSETRAKMSASQKGKRLGLETIARISAAKMGHAVSPETRAKLSAANRGKKRSPETNAKISVARKNPSPEFRAKLSAAGRGRTFSPELRAKISMANRGYWAAVRLGYEVRQ